MKPAPTSFDFDVVTFGETMALFAPAERDRLEFAAAYFASAAAALRAELFESLRTKYLFVTGITPALSEPTPLQ